MGLLYLYFLFLIKFELIIICVRLDYYFLVEVKLSLNLYLINYAKLKDFTASK